MQTQQLFARAIREAASGVSPIDAFALEVSRQLTIPDRISVYSKPLDQTLTVFLACILQKKYTNPSSDIITVLAGLDEVDHAVSDFVAMLDGVIRNGNNRESSFDWVFNFGLSLADLCPS